MSVDQQGPYRMPQPEQWLSEHLVLALLPALALLPFAIAALVVLLWGWL